MTHDRHIILVMRALCTWFLIGAMWDSGSLILWAPASDAHALARVTGYAKWVGWAFLACSLALVPMLVSNITPRSSFAVRGVAVLAASVAVCAAIMWIGLVYVGHYAADQDRALLIIRLLYLRNSAEALAFALLVSATVNAELRVARGVRRCDFGQSNRVGLGDR